MKLARAGMIATLLLASACARQEEHIYYLPEREPDNHLAVKVKEIRSAGGIDILWVIDNSGSMYSHQQNVIANAGRFMQEFLTKKISWKMGLVSTAVQEIPYIGFDRPFDNTDPNPEAAFVAAVSRLGTNGDGTEQTYDPILKSLTQYPNFLRADKPLAILIVTDAPEQSLVDAPTFLQSFRGIIGDRPLFVYSVLAASDLAPPGGCQTQEDGYNYANGRYEALALNAKIGRAFSLCDPNFGANLGKIGDEIVQQVFNPEIRLNRRPRPNSIKVFFHDTLLPAGPKNKGGVWYYDHDRNAIIFYNLDFAVGENEAVNVEFVTDDGFPDSSTTRPVPNGFVSSTARAPTAKADAWVEFPMKLESPHPYPNGGVVSPAIVIEGAKKLKLHFTKIDTESGYDSVEIYGKDGKPVQSLTGTHPAIWSQEIEGDRATVTLKADSSNTSFGYAISKIAVFY